MICNFYEVPEHLSKYRGGWPCLHGERYLTDVPVSDIPYKVCGAHLIESPCVVYSFGSDNEYEFEDNIERLNPHCATWTFDPNTTNYDRAVYEWGLYNSNI